MIKEHRDIKPHTLVIHNIDDEQGIDYEIRHTDECKKFVRWIDPFGQEIEEFECLVQYIFDNCGVQEIFSDHLQKELVLGEIEIIGCNNYDDYTHELDSWVEVYEND